MTCKNFIHARICGMNQHYRRYNFQAYLDNMERLGISNLELWAGPPHFLIDRYSFSDPKPYLEMAKNRGLHYSVLCSPSMMWQYQYGASGKERQENAISYYKNGVRAAAELGCKIVSSNAGWGYRDESTEECMKRSAEAIHEVAEFASRYDIRLALETLQPFESNIVNNLSDAQRFLKMVDSSNLKIMIDTVAMAVAGESVDQWFQVFGEQIIHCHLVDGTPSGHMTLGQGNLPVGSFLSDFMRNHYDGLFTLELSDEIDPFSADEKSLKIIDFITDLL